jgi:transcriptional regulator of acetoin/glycerol metabolism
MARLPRVESGWGSPPDDVREAESALRARWETFQRTGEIAEGVRAEIAASWRRSAGFGLEPGLRSAPVEETAHGFSGPGSPRRRFVAVSSEIADQLGAELADSVAVVVVCDDFGVVRHRAGNDAALALADAVNLVPGGVWSEASAGTTGIGLALAGGGAAHVYAGEHYAEVLHPFSCTAAVVRHPAMHEALGAVGLVTGTSIPTAFTRPLIALLALEVERRMQSQNAGRERALIEHYLRTGTGNAAPALTVDRSSHTVIQNARMLETASSEDVRLLLSLARRSLQAASDTSEQLELSRGSSRVEVRIVRKGAEAIGAVVALGRAGPTRPRSPVSEGHEWASIVGRSAAMQRLLREAGRVARHRMAVGLWGEPGTGKMMLAEAMHRAGGHDPLTVVHCASDEWEGELTRARHSGGTVVLRRVHALTSDAQLRLCDHLDALADDPTEVWVISLLNSTAPQPDPELLSRLARVSLTVPALRDREHDVRLLIEGWCAEREQATGVRPVIRPAAQEALAAQSWPGNVRELNNALDAAALRGGTVIGVEALALEPGPGELHFGEAGRSLRELEREAIESALERSGGNVSRAATELGIGRATLNRRLRTYRLMAAAPSPRDD